MLRSNWKIQKVYYKSNVFFSIYHILGSLKNLRKNIDEKKILNLHCILPWNLLKIDYYFLCLYSISFSCVVINSCWGLFEKKSNIQIIASLIFRNKTTWVGWYIHTQYNRRYYLHLWYRRRAEKNVLNALSRILYLYYYTQTHKI